MRDDGTKLFVSVEKPQPVMTSNKPTIVRLGTVALAFSAGMAITLAHGINISLSNWVQHPLRSAWVNFTVGWIVLMPLFIFCKQNTDEPDTNQSKNSIKQTLQNLI